MEKAKSVAVGAVALVAGLASPLHAADFSDTTVLGSARVVDTVEDESISANATISSTGQPTGDRREYLDEDRKPRKNKVSRPDMRAYSAKKEQLIGPEARVYNETRGAAAAASCYGDARNLAYPFENDGTWTLAMSPNDDDSVGPIALPFVFPLYGDTYTACWINNNGNISFDGPWYTYSPSGFPSSSFVMVAPFWGDVDTRSQDVATGLVSYKFVDGDEDGTNETLVVTWDNVGYYSHHTEKLNTFQVAISDGTNPAMGFANTVCFSYDDMCWTTGDASGGVGGFGGTPATVGCNRGNGTDFFQLGRFDHEGTDYDGPYGNPDGVSWLDGQRLCINTGSETNIPPVPQGFPPGNAVDVAPEMGESLDLTVQFLSPEAGQTTTVSITDPGGAQGAGLTIENTPGNVASVHLTWQPTCSDAGTYIIEFTATDDFDPPGVTDISLTINVGIDCNNNGYADGCDIADGTSDDCTSNGVPDECEPDCNGNGTADSCDIANGASTDCNANTVPDDCDIADGTSPDCNGNGTPDDCEPDCNFNTVPDDCDIADGTSADCNGNGIPDDCEPDCNGNGVADSCDIVDGTSPDCNSSGTPDECELSGNDCNANTVPDDCDVASGTSEDCQPDGIPDECQLSVGPSHDCCEIGHGPGCSDPAIEECVCSILPPCCDGEWDALCVELVDVFGCGECGTGGGDRVFTGVAGIIGLDNDCNANGVPDECDITDGTSQDCSSNGIPDECEPDCNANGIEDSCDIDIGTSQDCNANGVPDECDIASGAVDDCQPNGIPDDCEWAAYLSQPRQARKSTRQTLNLCQWPDQGAHGGVFIVPLDPELDVTAAEGFTFAEGTTITNLNWWGTYADECDEPCDATDDFTVTFYVNDGGPASNIVATYHVGGAVARSATGQTIPLGAGLAEYEYSFGLVPPLSVSAGERYWVEIRNNTGASCLWAWETAPEGTYANGTSLYDAEGDGYDDDDLVPYDLAFCVNGLSAAEDCNANGVPDSQDIFDGISHDCQPNDIPDECEDDGNYNGIPDECDIVSGISKDLNFNGLPDEADCLTMPGDLDGDCDVERDDLAIFLACMGQSEANILAGCVCADFDHNGMVDFDDYMAFSVVAGQPAVGCRVRPADACPDSWATAGGGGTTRAALADGETFYDFGTHGPIPAGFFGEGSDPFGEIVALVGTPADPSGVYGDIDTQIDHGPVIFDPETGEAQTTLDILTLELISKDPITVTYNGGQNPEQWLVVVGLSTHDPGSGELFATLDDPDANSGTYDATVYVQPAFLFVKLQDLVDHVLPECVAVRTLDTGEPIAQGGSASASDSASAAATAMPPITLSFTGEPFVRTVAPEILEQLSVPACAQGNFVPGVFEPASASAGRVAAAGQQLTCTSHITEGEAHYFCPPECEGEDVCKYTAIGPRIGLCTQFPSFPDAVLGQSCPNGQCSGFRVKQKPCVAGFGMALRFYGNPTCIPRESTCKGACCSDQGGCTLSTIALCGAANYKDGITSCSPNPCAACGNGVVEGSEACDDGNTADCDGCRGDCSAVEGTCGDGTLDSVCEACDDGNTADCDGCRGDCSAAEGTCGDGMLDSVCEACDDGDTIDNNDCTNACEDAECGDGIVWDQGTGTEACDDGNTDSHDGCSSDCTTEGACCDSVSSTCTPETQTACSGPGLAYQGDGSQCSSFQPSITQQPEDAYVCVGDDATFVVAATASSGSVHYQWKKNGADVGTDSSTLTLTNLQTSDDAGQIECDVSDACETVTSTAATLHVSTPNKSVSFTKSHHPDLTSPNGAQTLFTDGAALLLSDDDGSGDGGNNDDVCLNAAFTITDATSATFPDQSASTFPLAERYNYTLATYNDIPNDTVGNQLRAGTFADLKQVDTGHDFTGWANPSNNTIILTQAANARTSVHEWGHNCGLPHRGDSNAIMYGSFSTTKNEINRTERTAMEAY